MGLKELKAKIQKDRKEKEIKEHYFYCVVENKEDQEKVRSKFLESVGTRNESWVILDKLMYIVLDDRKETLRYERVLWDELLSLRDKKEKMSDKIEVRLGYTSKFGVYLFESEEDIKKRFAVSKPESSYAKYSRESDRKLEMTKQALLRQNGKEEEFIKGVLCNYLGHNFLIEGDITFDDIISKTITLSKDEFRGVYLDEGIRRTDYVCFLKRDAYKRGIEETIFEKYSYFNGIKLKSIYEEVIDSLNTNIVITKKGLSSLLSDYEEFDDVAEGEGYKEFSSYGLYVQSESAEIDFLLSNTILGRQHVFGEENMLRNVVGVMASYINQVMYIMGQIQVEKFLEDFYEKGKNKNIHVNEALLYFVEVVEGEK